MSQELQHCLFLWMSYNVKHPRTYDTVWNIIKISKQMLYVRFPRRNFQQLNMSSALRI